MARRSQMVHKGKMERYYLCIFLERLMNTRTADIPAKIPPGM
jgi:hypothetical protein